MRLLITTPGQTVVDEEGVVSVRAADESGGFGIMAGHVDFLTALQPSIIAWRNAAGAEHFCAVRRGVFTVTGGQEVAIATREAVAGDDLDRLEHEVLASFRQAADAERAERADSLKLQMRAIRQIAHYLRPKRQPFGGAP